MVNRGNLHSGRSEKRRGFLAVNCWNRKFFGLASALYVLAGALFLVPSVQAQDGSAKGKPGTKSGAQKKPYSASSQSQGEEVCKTERVECPKPGQDLIEIPKIEGQGIFKAVIKLTDGPRIMPATSNCLKQCVRYFSGHAEGQPEDPKFKEAVPLPGPTLRMHVGDLAEITFWNQVNPQHFARTLDQHPGNCDMVNTTGGDWKPSTDVSKGQAINPSANNNGRYTFHATNAAPGKTGATPPVFPQRKGEKVQDGTVTWENVGTGPIQQYPDNTGDEMPNCLHGSTTSNLHFHGTHTTPSTTGDNILLFIRPALRKGDVLDPTEKEVSENFKSFFDQCELKGPPALWKQMPEDWQKQQERLLTAYDASAGGKQQLWKANKEMIDKGLWPQYQIGAYPYCFKLPAFPEYKYKDTEPVKVTMGQAPGTHWYHAHKHGSTALNVANGIIGALIIEGDYDKDLHKFYSQGLKEQVLVLEQLSNNPFVLLLGGRPDTSVNGQLNPVVRMKKNEVQLWRIINGAFLNQLEFTGFAQGTNHDVCNKSPETCVNWRQIAQDGVQLEWDNYKTFGAQDNPFTMAPANRVDLLVKAPNQAGPYALQVVAQPGNSDNTASTLLTVQVEESAVDPPMDFITKKTDFPVFPQSFLKDIPEPLIKRELVFGGGFNTIDGKPFNAHHLNQVMLLNTDEEWTVKNQGTNKQHPFHIHVNPFQIVELFQPNSAEAKDKNDPECYADPAKPETWKPCKKYLSRINLQPPFVWWDTFAIPTARNDTFDCTAGDQPKCPVPTGGKCSANGQGVQQCTVNIPGYFKMRSRFVDFTGQYVLHCHILIHEDRGMMQLIEVVSDQTGYAHD